MDETDKLQRIRDRLSLLHLLGNEWRARLSAVGMVITGAASGVMQPSPVLRLPGRAEQGARGVGAFPPNKGEGSADVLPPLDRCETRCNGARQRIPLTSAAAEPAGARSAVVLFLQVFRGGFND